MLTARLLPILLLAAFGLGIQAHAAQSVLAALGMSGATEVRLKDAAGRVAVITNKPSVTTMRDSFSQPMSVHFVDAIPEGLIAVTVIDGATSATFFADDKHFYVENDAGIRQEMTYPVESHNLTKYDTFNFFLDNSEPRRPSP